MGRRGHSVSVVSLAPRHFMLVVYGGISEWLVDKSHRDQPVLTETAVVELRELFVSVFVLHVTHTHSNVILYHYK